MASKREKSAAREGSVPPKTFRVAQASAVIVGLVGGLIFLPPSLAWPLDILRGGSVTDGADVMGIVTGIGWTGLAIVVRHIVRPRLVLTGGELTENGFFLSRTIPLSEVTSIDRVEGREQRAKPIHVDTLYLFRGHPKKPWVIELGWVAKPSAFIAALRAECSVTYGQYTPQSAPPWARG